MTDPFSLLTVVHLVGLALAMGAATVKLALGLKTRRDPDFIPVFARVSRPITRLLVTGLLLLLASGAVWLILGYPIDRQLVVKLVLVAVVFVLGPVIDKAMEPAYLKLAPAPGEVPDPGFHRAQRRFFAIEIVATLIFYVITVYWVLR